MRTLCVAIGILVAYLSHPPAAFATCTANGQTGPAMLDPADDKLCSEQRPDATLTVAAPMSLMYRTGTGTATASGTSASIYNSVTLSNTNTATVTGTGTVGYVPKFTGASSIGNSSIYETAATEIVSTLQLRSSYAVVASETTGFYNRVYTANAANPIWAFANATAYGLSYYQYAGTPQIVWPSSL